MAGAWHGMMKENKIVQDPPPPFFFSPSKFFKAGMVEENNFGAMRLVTGLPLIHF